MKVTTKLLPNFEEEMTKFFHAYKKKMRINPRWRISIEVRREQDTFAKVDYDYDHHRFWMYVNDKMNGTVRELKDSIIHEFCHVILSPYTAKTEKFIKSQHSGNKLNLKKTEKSLENTEEAIVRKLTRILMDWCKKDV